MFFVLNGLLINSTANLKLVLTMNFCLWVLNLTNYNMYKTQSKHCNNDIAKKMGSVR